MAVGQEAGRNWHPTLMLYCGLALAVALGVVHTQASQNHKLAVAQEELDTFRSAGCAAVAVPVGNADNTGCLRGLDADQCLARVLMSCRRP